MKTNYAFFIILILNLLFFTKNYAQVTFQVSPLSHSLEKGIDSILIISIINKDSLSLPNNLTYDDITHFSIIKSENNSNQRFINTFVKNTDSTFFSFIDIELTDTIMEYTLVAQTSLGDITLGTSTTSFRSATSHLNCVKINKMYRKACHNCFDPTVVNNTFYQSLGMTRIVELDIHSHKVSGSQAPSGVWYVRHFSRPFIDDNNENNCGIGNKNFNICLEDVQQWHFDNPTHDPIIVFLDLKRRGVNPETGPFWRGNHKPSDLNNVLLQFAIDIGGVHNLYKPYDLKGNFLTTREAAENENWPSLGNLKGKIIFVLTGANLDLDQYVNDLKQINHEPMAFIAIKPDAFSTILNGYAPQTISPNAFKEVVFYNLDKGQLNIANTFTLNRGFMSRVYEGNSTTSSEYGNFVFNKINNIAIKNVWETNLIPYMDFQLIGINNITVGGTSSNPEFINSQYDHITQHALQTVTTQNLKVLSGTHYNISAGQEVRLKPGTEIKAGADTRVFISNCEDYIDNMRINPYANQEQGRALTQQEIDWMLNYAKTNAISTEKTDMITQQPTIFPNPTSGNFTVTQLEQFAGGNIEITNLMGQTVFSQPINTNTLNINLSHQPKGIYLIKISSQKQNVVRKVVLE